MSKIQWTDVTDNIIVAAGGGWWCRKISPGCANCYAAALNQSDFFGGNKLPYRGAPPPMALRESLIDSWKSQTKPRRHFVASMTDVFGEWVHADIADRFLSGMLAAPLQTFQVLTKRPIHAAALIQYFLSRHGLRRLPDNIQIGVSVEDTARAYERIPELLTIPAAVRFLSIEPMLERIDLLWWPRHLSWIIYGGESGPHSRPCEIAWIEDGLRQARAAGVAPFVKQLGTATAARLNLRDKKGGDPAEWPEHLRVREFPKTK